ncbi:MULTISPECIES: competence protein CoiA [Lysinibacillus]|uniref:Competence protein CoiA family protein n=1 Tax=Lysinibacillus irui TaxID=2998077 RepID=A0AAJ5RLH1_9BACI|nr:MULTISPECIES: competence protein CoiA family protein [Lysinibacillus]MEA0561801.1 competence protein CoiA family protein [Lysinibacillus irui]WDV07523.1 competence protein CoiA family protein [Lysinibacillus irui]
MLIAYNNQLQLFLPYQYTRKALQRYRRQMKFFCPQCLEPVQLKIGHSKIPHFAHLTNNKCSQLFSEGESKLHLQGKIQLYEWLKKLKYKVKLEPFLNKLSQRPDILVTMDDKHFAFEYQCSTIPHEIWDRRTEGYEKNGIQAIWLFQTPQSKDTLSGICKIKIPPLLQKAFILDAEELPYLITYNAKTAHFIYWTNLLPIHGHTFIGKVQVIPIDQQLFPFYLPKRITQAEFQQYWQLYKHACRQFAYGRLLHSKKGTQDSFLRTCYELKLSLTAMPSYIGIPVKEGAAISLFTSEWQTMLLHFSKRLGMQSYELDRDLIQQFLREHQIERTEQAINAVQHYGHFLKNIKQGNHSQDIYKQVYAHLFAIVAIY